MARKTRRRSSIAAGMARCSSYYTLNEHTFGLHVIIANKDWFESL